ncbi:MAG: peptide chain release factor N(5)-glutamine methyltransferase [Oligoflexia bacterium]|nr:peptide chain release factor N(5)-glutamine methyltransferase [Oligoflexia bacterium]
MKLGSAVSYGINSLSAIFEKNSRENSCDVYFLLSCLLDKSISELKNNPDILLTAEQAARFKGWIERRMKYEPVQYITGETEFWSHKIRVSSGVLVPRQDSETIISEVVRHLNPGGKYRFLDLCSGSGCLGIALLGCFPDSFADFVDKYPAPLEYTRLNISKNGYTARTDVIGSDMFDELQKLGKTGSYDAIVSNPPYISTEDLLGLPVNIVNFEPNEALKGGENGLLFHSIIADKAIVFLKKGGLLFLEIGFNQSEQVVRLFGNGTWTDVRVVNDLNNNPRVLIAKKP